MIRKRPSGHLFKVLGCFDKALSWVEISEI